jgi:uncharacterized protein
LTERVHPLEPIHPSAGPLPGRAFIRQDWRDAVFLHWRVPASAVAPLLPPGTRPDEFGGSSWVGLIAFVLADTTIPPLPTMHRLGTFVEINVRLYSVDAEGRRGVVFRSLEAGALFAVLAAQAGLGLPYKWADAHVHRDGAEIDYRSHRRTTRAPATRIRARDDGPLDAPDELTHFLTARWGMHVHRFGATRFWPNEHGDWPLHRATLLHLDDQLVAAAGLPGVAARAPDSVLFSPGVRSRFAFPG